MFSPTHNLIWKVFVLGILGRFLKPNFYLLTCFFFFFFFFYILSFIFCYLFCYFFLIPCPSFLSRKQKRNKQKCYLLCYFFLSPWGFMDSKLTVMVVTGDGGGGGRRERKSEWWWLRIVVVRWREVREMREKLNQKLFFFSWHILRVFYIFFYMLKGV